MKQLLLNVCSKIIAFACDSVRTTSGTTFIRTPLYTFPYFISTLITDGADARSPAHYVGPAPPVLSLVGDGRGCPAATDSVKDEDASRSGCGDGAGPAGTPRMTAGPRMSAGWRADKGEKAVA